MRSLHKDGYGPSVLDKESKWVFWQSIVDVRNEHITFQLCSSLPTYAHSQSLSFPGLQITSTGDLKSFTAQQTGALPDIQWTWLIFELQESSEKAAYVKYSASTGTFQTAVSIIILSSPVGENEELCSSSSFSGK